MCLMATFVGEPDAANPHVLFNERGVETGMARLVRHRLPKGPETARPGLNDRAIPRLYMTRRR